MSINHPPSLIALPQTLRQLLYEATIAFYHCFGGLIKPKKHKEDVNTLERIKQINKVALNMFELAAVLGIGRSKAFELTRQPGFPAVRIGRRILIPVDALNEWLAEQVKSNDDL